jgi:hypothetical protein
MQMIRIIGDCLTELYGKFNSVTPRTGICDITKPPGGSTRIQSLSCCETTLTACS